MVFAAEGNAASPRVDEDQPRKKSTDDDDDRPRKKKKDKPAKSGGEKKESGNSRSSRSARAIPTCSRGAVLSGLLLLGIFIGAILWFFNRKSASQEMMMYLPDDCDEVSGINLGHLQKYPEFYKSCESAFGNTGFKHAADIFCDALGEKTNDVVDYVVQGVGRAGGTGQEVAATVFHTKVDYDTTLLSKLSGANKGTRNGVDYYLISDIPGLNYGGIKVFAPTKRLVVFCRADTPDAKFDAMLNGNKDNPDATPFKRGGQLSKAIIRGTAWKFMIYGRSVTKFAGPRAPTGGGGGPAEGKRTTRTPSGAKSPRSSKTRRGAATRPALAHARSEGSGSSGTRIRTPPTACSRSGKKRNGSRMKKRTRPATGRRWPTNRGREDRGQRPPRRPGVPSERRDLLDSYLDGREPREGVAGTARQRGEWPDTPLALRTGLPPVRPPAVLARPEGPAPARAGAPPPSGRLPTMRA